MSRAAPASLASADSTIAFDCSTPSTLIADGSCGFKPKSCGAMVYSRISPSFSSAIMVGPLIEISSSPSTPWTIITRRLPRRCSTRA